MLQALDGVWLVSEQAVAPSPKRFRMASAGQKPVKADWKRLSPTKSVNNSQPRLYNCANPTLRITRLPANNRTHRSKDIGRLLFNNFIEFLITLRHAVKCLIFPEFAGEGRAGFPPHLRAASRSDGSKRRAEQLNRNG